MLVVVYLHTYVYIRNIKNYFMYLETPTSHHATTKAYLSRIVKDNWDCNEPKHMNPKKIKGTTDTDIAFMLTNSKVTFTQNML